jgi:hypothetical protein
MSNEILLVLLGIAVVLLGLSGEVTGQGGRAMRVIAAVLGLVVVLAALLR